MHAAYTTVTKDGHGRKAQGIVRGKLGSSPTLTTITTNYGYSASGQTLWVSRTNGSATVRQDLKYDSLDDLVENQEPNTTNGTNDWRYVYDVFGRLVATSDARGCGENIAYDPAGRKFAEDFSPCLGEHPDYTAPTSTGNNYEVVYLYDGPIGQTPTAPDGHLHAMADRAALTAYQYDVRGRQTRVDRALIKQQQNDVPVHLRLASSPEDVADEPRC
jgi:hypothetical protein